MALKLNISISLSLLLLLHITAQITSTIVCSLPPPPPDDSFNSQPPKINNTLISFDNKTNISPPHKSSSPAWGILVLVLDLILVVFIIYRLLYGNCLVSPASDELGDSTVQPVSLEQWQCL
ncbi:hypothetical protein TSUD_15810 [Trifolium subterraneum]|uniref:Transmembrane protein n=1 Tax=Trifolium subterraneum TaxID=3900 RepID=A0A2Z6MVS0_TRISU|nr:hypothetical protein TSUD_15810 [Trifolium subterraneum]